jgi:hypothetical protein
MSHYQCCRVLTQCVIAWQTGKVSKAAGSRQAGGFASGYISAAALCFIASLHAAYALPQSRQSEPDDPDAACRDNVCTPRSTREGHTRENNHGRRPKGPSLIFFKIRGSSKLDGSMTLPASPLPRDSHTQPQEKMAFLKRGLQRSTIHD